MSGHTPGPWTAIEHYSDAVSVIDSRGFEIVQAETFAILHNYAEKLGIGHWAQRSEGESFIELGGKEQAANARLIAAAPDLLEALQVMTEVFKPRAHSPTQAHVEHAAHDKARAAIEKATRR